MAHGRIDPTVDFTGAHDGVFEIRGGANAASLLSVGEWDVDKIPPAVVRPQSLRMKYWVG